MRTTRNELPPDLDNQNDNRAEWAASALRQFQCVTGTDFEDALADLLCNPMHWAGRNGYDFNYQLSQARRYYAHETRPDDLPVSTEERERMDLPSFQRFDAARHPQTSEHLAGCVSCKVAHTKATLDYGTPEWQANAALRAAAPDLLAALQRIVATYGETEESTGFGDGCWVDARAAIAKAKAVQP
jgi:hypothetical protein